jgi:putative salt-induced outer membrane protein YdiY
MRIRFGIVLLLFSLAVAPLWADQITLKNGDRVTGMIVKKDGATLTIDSVYFGTVTLPWDQVQSFTTDVPAYVQAGGQTVVATLSGSGGEVEIRPTTGGERSVAIADIATIRNNREQASYGRLQNPGLTDLWAGSANLGFAGAAGNARTKTFTFDSSAARATRTDKTTLHFNAVSASALVGGVTSSTARAVRGGWAYQRNVSGPMFFNVFNDYEYDRFQSLDLRFVFGAGGGYHAIDSERTKLDVLAGVNYERATFSTPLTRNSAEFNWGDQLNHKLNSIVTLTQSYRMFNSLTDTPNYRVNFDLGSVTRLGQWLTWNVSISDRYLRNPVPGRLRNDVIYSTGLGVTLGTP